MRLFDGVYFSSRFCSFFPNTLAPPLRFCYNQSCRPQGADECFSLPSNFTQSGSSPPRRTPLIFFFRGACFFYEHQLRQLPRLLLRRQIPQLLAGRRGALQQPAQCDTYDSKARIRARLRAVFPLAASRPRGRSSTRTSPSRLRASRQAKRRSSPTRACKAVSSTSQRAALPCARGFCRCSRATGAHTRTCASA